MLTSWETGREEVQRATNKKVEVYVKIGLCLQLL